MTSLWIKSNFAASYNRHFIDALGCLSKNVITNKSLWFAIFMTIKNGLPWKSWSWRRARHASLYSFVNVSKKLWNFRAVAQSKKVQTSKSSARSKMVMNNGWLLTHFRETSWVHKLFSCGSFVRVVSLRRNIVWDCSVVYECAVIYPRVTR